MNGQPRIRIQDVEKPKMSRPRRNAASSPPPQNKEPKSNHVVRRHRRRGFFRSPLFGILVVLTVIIVGASLISTLFARASISVTLRELPVSFEDEAVSADQEALLVGEQIPYLLRIEYVPMIRESISIPTEEEETVEVPAVGTITVFNEFGTQAITLAATTRFQSPSGLVYRTPKQVVIPGQRTVDGRTVPGSIDIEVFADAAGVEYNIEEVGVELRAPGFKEENEDDYYDAVYAHSKTPISGGFSGTRFVVDALVLSSARSTLRDNLERKLFETAQDAPDDIITFEELQFIRFSNFERTDNEDQREVTISESATLDVIGFREDEFTEFLWNIILQDGEEITLAPTHTKDRALSITLDEEILDPREKSEISFLINGEATLLWSITPDEVINTVQGISRDEVSQVLEEFPEIESVGDISIFPRWKSKLPTAPSSISIEIEN